MRDLGREGRLHGVRVGRDPVEDGLVVAVGVVVVKNVEVRGVVGGVGRDGGHEGGKSRTGGSDFGCMVLYRCVPSTHARQPKSDLRQRLGA